MPIITQTKVNSMSNILLFEFSLEGKFLSVYCGMLQKEYFAWAFFDGKSAFRTFERKQCRIYKEEFYALDNVFTPERLKFFLLGDIEIECDLKITPLIWGRGHIGLFNILPRNSRAEIIAQLCKYEGKVSINGKSINVKSVGYIHKLNAKKIPQNFYALNLLGDNVCLASYMSDNWIYIYNFNTFITEGIIKGRQYKFADYNFTTPSIIDTGNNLIIKLNKGRYELNICAECGTEKLINKYNLALRANNYTTADIVLRFDGKIIFKEKAAASLLIRGKIKIGKKAEEIQGLCEAAT